MISSNQAMFIRIITCITQRIDMPKVMLIMFAVRISCSLYLSQSNDFQCRETEGGSGGVLYKSLIVQISSEDESRCGLFPVLCLYFLNHCLYNNSPNKRISNCRSFCADIGNAQSKKNTTITQILTACWLPYNARESVDTPIVRCK